ncbi:allantoicase [Cokeromyces recurvatus]|uniref:allantoicase n=1 Tax=Cokeromyces recurvatus TaxID=90255 RepID=UPI00221FB44B|nr:allantoicase [Cokeromyces recurvatus]KAI7898876.1 allantoicase [Cokeromyces recurvatus]
MIEYERIEFKQLKESPLGECIDLASSALGSTIVAVTDEFFAPAINMINPLPPIHAPGKFVETGAWMDGWETRRHNPNHDWAIIKLGFPGSFRGFDIDTSYFTGNQAPFVSVEGTVISNNDKKEIQAITEIQWTEILPKVELLASQHNLFILKKESTVYTHLRLHNIPDGGIARFRAYGFIFPIWPKDINAVIDLAFCGNGGRVVKVSDQHYTPGSNILLPGRGKNMGDGWETKRSRTPDHTDYAIVRLGSKGHLLKAVVDTLHFCGNYPNKISLKVILSEHDKVPPHKDDDHTEWTTLIESASIGPNGLFSFDLPQANKTFSHAKIILIPDGGIKRLRLYGVREGALIPSLLPIDNLIIQ